MKGSGCYNCPVKSCIAEYRGSWCARLRELAGVDFDPMTSGDCLRSMNDEELEDQLVFGVEGMAPCKIFIAIPTGQMFISREAAKESVRKWLKQPIERERDAAVKCIEEIEDALNFKRMSAIGLRISEWRGRKKEE